MKALKRFASWAIFRMRKVIEPDLTASHYSLHSSSYAPHPDYYDDTVAGQRRGEYQDDFLAGYPRRQDPNATCAGFPRRAGIVVGHGWRIPTPPRLPVYD
ncbi:MAG TPA: hypothetical protein VEL49_10315 [Ktedonobacteraceae bacterium]|nr:hypothetical protein [Ktedonobacteraceae bacterium]